MADFLEQFEKELRGFVPKPRAAQGVVLRAQDGIAEVDGLRDVVPGELVRFEPMGALNDVFGEPELSGLVLNLEEDVVRIVVLGDAARVREGMVVLSGGDVLSVPVGDALIGRIVSPLGEPLDGAGPVDTAERRPVERVAPGVMEREGVNTPLHTGIKAIDAMIPIGRGQRELIVGDRYTGKTTIAIDTILNQKSEPKDSRPICIYVAIGQKESKTARLVQLLRERGALEYTVIVNAGASASAALQYLAPFAGAAIGEYFMESGRDALVVYDDLSKHAVAYRQLSLLLRRPPGREAYPGDVFYLHSRLLERAAKLSKERGGGSLTALPIIETQEGDVSGYIPTNVISITDGQIFLEPDLFNKGVRPAVNAGLSVSRVGSAAQTKAMKKVSGKLRLDLAQFRELEAFMQFSSDLDEETKKQIARGQRLVAALNQKNSAPIPFERQAVVLHAAINGFLEHVALNKVSEFETKFLAHMDGAGKVVLDSIRRARDIASQTEAELKSQLKVFMDTHGAQLK